jgi:hypothetical protein
LWRRRRRRKRNFFLLFCWLYIYSQNAILKTQSAKIMYFLKKMINSQNLTKILKKKCRISMHVSSR